VSSSLNVHNAFISTRRRRAIAKGYLIVHLEVTDPAKFEEYRGKVADTVARSDGKYLVRGEGSP
jgi:hypothetical protein